MVFPLVPGLCDGDLYLLDLGCIVIPSYLPEDDLDKRYDKAMNFIAEKRMMITTRKETWAFGKYGATISLIDEEIQYQCLGLGDSPKEAIVEAVASWLWNWYGRRF